MLRLKPSEFFGASSQILLPGEPDYTFHDLSIRVAALPSVGTVRKGNRLTPVLLGDTLTGDELAALTFSSASPAAEVTPWHGSVVYVPENCGRLPIPSFTHLRAAGSTTPVVIDELPFNG